MTKNIITNFPPTQLEGLYVNNDSDNESGKLSDFTRVLVH